MRPVKLDKFNLSAIIFFQKKTDFSFTFLFRDNRRRLIVPNWPKNPANAKQNSGVVQTPLGEEEEENNCMQASRDIIHAFICKKDHSHNGFVQRLWV
jgi:hypothetical protein